MLRTKYEYENGIRTKQENRKRPWQEDVYFFLKNDNISTALVIALRNKDNNMAEKIFLGYRREGKVEINEFIGEAATISGCEIIIRESVKKLGDRFRLFSYINNHENLYDKIVSEENVQENKNKKDEHQLGLIIRGENVENSEVIPKFLDSELMNSYAKIMGILGRSDLVINFGNTYKNIARLQATFYDQISVIMDTGNFMDMDPNIIISAAANRITPFIDMMLFDLNIDVSVVYCIVLGSIRGRYLDTLSACLLLKVFDNEILQRFLEEIIEIDSVDIMECFLSLTEKPGIRLFNLPKNKIIFRKNIEKAYNQDYFKKLISDYS